MCIEKDSYRELCVLYRFSCALEEDLYVIFAKRVEICFLRVPNDVPIMLCIRNCPTNISSFSHCHCTTLSDPVM